MRTFSTKEPGPFTVSGYDDLADVLILAYRQSSGGKGKERHAAAGAAFAEQPIMAIGRMVGVGFALGQVQKKAQEAGGMASRGDFERAKAELLGVIVYAAAAYLTVAETEAKVKDLASPETSA